MPSAPVNPRSPAAIRQPASVSPARAAQQAPGLTAKLIKIRAYGQIWRDVSLIGRGPRVGPPHAGRDARKRVRACALGTSVATSIRSSLVWNPAPRGPSPSIDAIPIADDVPASLEGAENLRYLAKPW